MSGRCVACDRELSEYEMSDKGGMCRACKRLAFARYNISDKDYAFQDITEVRLDGEVNTFFTGFKKSEFKDYFND